VSQISIRYHFIPVFLLKVDSNPSFVKKLNFKSSQPSIPLQTSGAQLKCNNNPTESCSSPSAVSQSQSSFRTGIYLVGTDKNTQLTLLSQHKFALTAIIHFFQYKIIRATKKIKNQPRLFLRPVSVNFCLNFSTSLRGQSLSTNLW
jgi:hypothetical protein